MWYRAIPPALLTLVFSYHIPMYSPWLTNMLDTGRPHRRSLTDVWACALCNRDEWLSGNMYVIKGLESVPDA